MEQKKLIIIIEGPSGVGKDSIMKGLISTYPDCYQYLPSTATREMRPGEVQGDPYFFVTVEEFQKQLKSGEVFEHTERHGTYRGMSKRYVEEILAGGKVVLKCCDLTGINALRDVYPDAVYTIFITADREEIEARMKRRGDTAQDMQTRLRDFDRMMQTQCHFDYSVENRDLNIAIAQIHNIVQRLKQATT
jgi:guanylate kinase